MARRGGWLAIVVATAGVLALAVVAREPRPARLGARVAAAEAAFAELRRIDDEVELAQARGSARTTAGEDVAALGARWPEVRRRVEVLLAPLTAAAGRPLSATADAVRRAGEVSGSDRAALGEMWRALAAELAEPPRAPSEAGVEAVPECAYDAGAWAARPDGLALLTERVYACYGYAAADVQLDGRALDRLTVLGLLGTTDDGAERRRLFLALEPVWRSVNGDGSPASPYRRLLALRARAPEVRRGLVQRKAQELGLRAEEVERWIVGILEAWRDVTRGAARVEPWDFYYANGAAARALGGRIGSADLRRLNDRFYRGLGVDVEGLRVHYDLGPRPGKTPVAFTTFGLRGRLRAGRWEPSEPWVFATYRVGGFDNLAELLHETGHALHVAAIRTRPALVDWPDNDTFTEAVADVAAVDLYEPEWQRFYLGASVPSEVGLRARYASVALDAAWSLFELRVHADPSLDPNRVWAQITSEYLGLWPHPEWSWWALRGQLIESPGYLANYAVGAVLTADLRARLHAQRGPSASGDPGWYGHVSERLLRFGRERPVREVLASFLGRPPSPEALFAELRRAAPAR